MEGVNYGGDGRERGGMADTKCEPSAEHEISLDLKVK